MDIGWDDAIEAVDVTVINMPLSRNFHGSVYSVSEKSAVITRVRTRQGLTGEAINGEGGLDTHRRVAALLREEIASNLIGSNPFRIEHCWQTAFRSTYRGGGDKRVAVRAVACMDSALWDLTGKVLNLPLYRLWGFHRDRLPIIAIGGQYVEGYRPSDYGREIEAFRALGMGGCKFKVGGLSPAEDAERVRAAREAGGPDFVLCVDANRGWSAADAVSFARRVADLDIAWFEEPCHWQDDRRDMADVRIRGGLPIAAGQSEITAEGCRDLMRERAIDICNLDASWGGGPTVWRRVAGLAACFGADMAHHGEPIIGAHLLASAANGTYVETHHPERDPVFHRLVLNRGAIADGLYELPKGAGWGVELDPDLVAHYTID